MKKSHSPYPPQTQYVPPQPPQQPYQQQAFQQPYPQPAGYPQHLLPSQNLDSLKKDIADLIGRTKAEFAANTFDNTLRDRLKALVDLQIILEKQQLPPHELQAIRDQVAQLSAASKPTSVPPPYVPPPHLPHHQPHRLQQTPAQLPAPQTNDIQALLSSRNLADIIAKAQQNTSTPPTAHAASPQTQQPPVAAPSTPSVPGSDLLAMLRANGMLPSNSNTPTNGSLGYPSSTTNTPPILSASLVRPSMINDVELTSASLKRHVCLSLYPCT